MANLMDITNVDSSLLLPAIVGQDLVIRAVLSGIDARWRTMAAAVPLLGVLATIEQQPAEVLDRLAWQFHVDFYDATWDLARKRAVIIDSIRLHRIAGTRGAVEDVIRSIWDDGALLYEWWEYGGEPGTFSVVLTSPQTQEQAELFGRSITKVKRATDHVTVTVEQQLGELGSYIHPAYHQARFVQSRELGQIAAIDEGQYYDLSGILVAFGRKRIDIGSRGSSHMSTDRTLRLWENDGSGWTSREIYPASSYARNTGGGLSAAGTIILVFRDYASEPNRLVFLRSIDEGATWTEPQSINLALETAPYGPLVEFPTSHKLMQTFYEIDGAGVYTVFALFSEDDGQSWGGRVDMVTGAGSYWPSETAAVALSETELVAFSRNDHGGPMHQLYSTDGGATWTDLGVPACSADTDISPWVCVDPYDSGRILLLWGRRRDYRILQSRTPAADYDQLGTWEPVETLHTANNGNMGYPVIAKTNWGAWLHWWAVDPAQTPPWGGYDPIRVWIWEAEVSRRVVG